MAMSSSSGPQINVTPMIDILLVLIIIFMVVTLPSARGLDTKVPQSSHSNQPAQVQQDIVLTIEGGGNVLVNQDAVAAADLGPRLRAIYVATARPVVFVRGKKGLAFQEVAEVIDLARGIGFQNVALLTE